MEYIIAIYTVLLICVQYLLGSVLVRSIQAFVEKNAPAIVKVLPGGSDVDVHSSTALNKEQAFFVNGMGARNYNPLYIPFVWLFGLLAHLCFVFLLKSLGANWPIAILLPFFLIGLALSHVHDAFSALILSARSLIHIPFLIWFGVQCVIGVSLFSVSDGIKTPWVNNYGDLAFHLGMITQFVGVGDFPPQYHLYSEQGLSYPFFVNLWSAVLWWPSSLSSSIDFTSLSWVFCIQWVLLWSCVYYFIGRGKSFFLPWVLLLGGGSYVAIFNQPETYSWRLISEGFPWTTWLSTIWVTQRSALMGMAVCLACCALVFNLPRFTHVPKCHIVLAGVLLGLMPLVHTHYFVFTALFLGAYLFIQACIEVYRCYFSEAKVAGSETAESKSAESKLASEEGIKPASLFALASVQCFFALFLPALIALVFFPFLLGKSGLAQGMLGWHVPLLPAGLTSIVGSAKMWAVNAPQWGIAFIGVWWLSRRHLLLSILLGLFLIANVVKLAIWDWDQIKVFLAIFTLFTVVWCHYLLSGKLLSGPLLSGKLSSSKLSRKSVIFSLCLALVLCGPGTYELWRIWQKGDNYQVYDPSKLALAQLIDDNTPKDAVIASPPDHNSAATLSGRTLFFGYVGTLASHSIDYRERELIHMDIQKIRRCHEQSRPDFTVCPSFIVWDSSARKYWHRVSPGPGFEKVASTDKGQYSLYKVITK